MMELRGKYNTAKVFTDNVEKEAQSQIIELCSQEFAQYSKIRIMSDVHAGKGCTIGTTMTILDKVVPNIVGVDIECAIFSVLLKDKLIDLEKLDKVIRDNIPVGQEVRQSPYRDITIPDLRELACTSHINKDRAFCSVGTLGGGNHFIEVDRDMAGNLYLNIHSGSRYLGKQVADYYQKLGYSRLTASNQQALIAKMKAEGRHKDIHKELSSLKRPPIKKELAYVEGQDFKDYLHDMEIIRKYADANRTAIAKIILEVMGMDYYTCFSTVHNYIDTKTMILRKGAISARKGELVLIPLNMRDGCLLCTGKGNPDWNYSAPHGAGRIMSRAKAKQAITLEQFKASMEGIYTTSVDDSTIDESPGAYKPYQEIIDCIGDTVEIIDRMVPIYNFKASKKEK